MFKQNESNLDKNIRLAIGVVASFLGIFVFTGSIKVMILIIGVLGIFTGLTGFCLIYRILGIKTKK